MTGYIIYKDKEYAFEYQKNIINIYAKNITEIYDNFQEQFDNNEKESIYVLNGYVYPNLNMVEFVFISGITNILGEHKVDMKIEYRDINKKEFNQIKFISNVIDAIYGIDHYVNKRKKEPNGKQTIELKSYKGSDSKTYKFKFNQMDTKLQFQTKRIWSRNTNAMLSRTTYLDCKFSSDINYKNLYEFINVIYNFLSFIIYSKNVKFKSILLYNSNEYIGNLECYRDSIQEEVEIEDIKRYLKIEYIEKYIGKLLNKIANNEIYLRNLPYNFRYLDGKEILMTTAGFEYVFKKVYKEIKHRDKTIKMRNDLKTRLEEIKENITVTREKNMIDYMIKNYLDDDDIKAKIIEVNKKMYKIPEKIVRELLKINNRTDKFNNVCEQVRVIRNKYAHGDLNVEMKNKNRNAIIGVIMLERIIYLMQLKEIGIEDEKIYNEVLNDIFCMRID